MTPPVCPYCGNESEPCTGADLFPSRRELALKRYYRCVPCDAHVGAHIYTRRPYGTPAKLELRRLRSQAHGVFDPLWQSGEMTRAEAYAWLAAELGRAEVHIGWMTEVECREAIYAVIRRMGGRIPDA